jgi:hypothetical protein
MRFQVSPLRLPGYAGQAAQPPAWEAAGLINERNFKKHPSFPASQPLSQEQMHRYGNS